MSSSAAGRSSFRDEIAQAAVELVVSGELPADSRLKDSYLAERLGTSPTPAREALIELARRGFVRAIPQRGFWIPPLDKQEVGDLYPLVATLEAMAMEASSPLAPAQSRSLTRIGRAMANASLERLRWLNHDRQWHEALLAGCTNQRLMPLLRDLRLQIQRYEVAFANIGGDIAPSVEEHSAIAKAFQEDDQSGAAAALRAHWQRGMEMVLHNFE